MCYYTVVKQAPWGLNYWTLIYLNQKKRTRPLCASCLPAEWSSIVGVLVLNISKITFENCKVSLQKPAFLGLSTNLPTSSFHWGQFICKLQLSSVHLWAQRCTQYTNCIYLMLWVVQSGFGTIVEVSAAQISKPQQNEIRTIYMERYHWGWMENYVKLAWVKVVKVSSFKANGDQEKEKI